MEINNPKFSIIVVAYKKYNELKCLLYSLLAQSYNNFEIILIHDGVDNKHKDLFENFENDSRITYLQTPIRHNDWGMSLRNKGIKLAKGEWVINTNDDNYYTFLTTILTRYHSLNDTQKSSIVKHLNIKPVEKIVYVQKKSNKKTNTKPKLNMDDY